jgi:hypothetical protein
VPARRRAHGSPLSNPPRRGELQCIGATTLDEFHKHIEKDAALERRFAPIYVEEPSVDDTIKMLQGLRDRYEAHHKVRFSDDALVAAARLAERYVTDRHLPDKAIDLMDESAAKLRVALYSMPPELKEAKTILDRMLAEEAATANEGNYQRAAEIKVERLRHETDYRKKRTDWESEHKLDEVVDVNDIAEVVHQWTGIPVSQMMETESQKLLHMEERLHERIIGQEEAIHAISDAIRRARSGLKDQSRPIGSFIFIGPSGVKTEHEPQPGSVHDEAPWCASTCPVPRRNGDRLIGASRLRGLRGRRPTDRGRPTATLPGAAVRRDRKSPPRSLERAAADPGRRPHDRRAGQRGGFPQQRAHHDLQPGHRVRAAQRLAGLPAKY